MPTYYRNNSFDHHSDNNPLDALPHGPRLWRRNANNRSRPAFPPRNPPPRLNSNNYRHSRNASNPHHHHHHHHDHHHRHRHRHHQYQQIVPSGYVEHSPNVSNQHHHHHHDHHHRHRHHHHQHQQIVPVDYVEHYQASMIWEGRFDLLSNHEDQYPVTSRGYRLQSQENVIVLNGEIQEWNVYHSLVLIDHVLVLDDAVEQSGSSSNSEDLSEEEISNCLKLKTKGDDDSEEKGICVICQDDLFPHEEEQEEDNDKQKVAVISPCGHEYHYDCVAKWLQQKNSCPLCKAIPRPAL